MKSPRVRRLAFELLESKASPSAILLALAPLDELDQRIIEAQRVMYAPVTATRSDRDAAVLDNAALLEFIERNTRAGDQGPTLAPATPAEAEAADSMMTATDTDLRTMLISEMLEANSPEGENVFSVIQF